MQIIFNYFRNLRSYQYYSTFDVALHKILNVEDNLEDKLYPSTFQEFVLLDTGLTEVFVFSNCSLLRASGF